jgi:hypothetical protein
MLRDNFARLAPERALPPAAAQSNLTDEIGHPRLPFETVPLPVLQNRGQGSGSPRVHMDDRSGPMPTKAVSSGGNGFVLLHRSLCDHPLADRLSSAWFRIFILILLRVNWKPNTWFDGFRMIDIPAGSMVTSIRSLSKMTGTTMKQIRGALGYLERARTFSVQGTQRYTIITVLNWASYQTPGGITSKQMSDRKDLSGAQGGQHSNKGTIKKATKHTTPQGGGIVVSGSDVKPSKADFEKLQESWFDDFWRHIWRHDGKSNALRIFKLKAVSEVVGAKIIAAAKAQQQKYLVKEEQYRPDAATWLSQDRFNDEPPIAIEAQQQRRTPTAREVLAASDDFCETRA